jgi:hypothetical protein
MESDVLAATRHALAWAPASPYVQATVLWSLTRLPDGGPARQQAEALVRPLLNLDRPQPEWFFPAAARLIGLPAMERALMEAGPHLGESALPWLARSGSAACWLQVRRVIAHRDPPLTAPGQWLAVAELVDHPRHDPPLSRDRRVELALSLHQAGLPLPDPLAEALVRDGQPWALLVRDPLAADVDTRATLAETCAAALWQPWARDLAARLSALAQVEAGLTTHLGAGDEPWLIETARKQPGLDAAERNRLGLLLSGRDHPTWLDLPGVRWTWLSVPSGNIPPRSLDLVEWTGIAVDGIWRGWWRGRCDVAAIAGPGLHRIAVITAP